MENQLVPWASSCSIEPEKNDSDDELMEEVREQVEILSSKTNQLLDFQVKAAHFSKAYTDACVGSVSDEARNNAEALCIAVSQVHMDQQELKSHLSAHLHTVEGIARQKIDSLAQDIATRHHTALEESHQQVSQLDHDVKCSEARIKITADTLSIFQTTTLNRIEELERSANKSIHDLGLQLTELKLSVVAMTGDRLRVEERLENVARGERRIAARLEHITSASQDAVATAVTRLSSRIDKTDAVASRTNAQLTDALEAAQLKFANSLEVAKGKLTHALESAGTRCADALEEAKHQLESKIKQVATSAPVALIDQSVSIVELREQCSSQARELAAVQMRMASCVTMAELGPLLQALQGQVNSQADQLGTLRGSVIANTLATESLKTTIQQSATAQAEQQLRVMDSKLQGIETAIDLRINAWLDQRRDSLDQSREPDCEPPQPPEQPANQPPANPSAFVDEDAVNDDYINEILTLIADERDQTGVYDIPVDRVDELAAEARNTALNRVASQRWIRTGGVASSEVLERLAAQETAHRAAQEAVLQRRGRQQRPTPATSRATPQFSGVRTHTAAVVPRTSSGRRQGAPADINSQSTPSDRVIDGVGSAHRARRRGVDQAREQAQRAAHRRSEVTERVVGRRSGLAIARAEAQQQVQRRAEHAAASHQRN